MFNVPNPEDFVLAQPLRWQGILYAENSPLPKGMNAAAINRFLHRTPPLVKAVSSNGNGASAKPATSKKTPRKKASKKARKKAGKKKAAKR